MLPDGTRVPSGEYATDDSSPHSGARSCATNNWASRLNSGIGGSVLVLVGGNEQRIAKSTYHLIICIRLVRLVSQSCPPYALQYFLPESGLTFGLGGRDYLRFGSCVTNAPSEYRRNELFGQRMNGAHRCILRRHPLVDAVLTADLTRPSLSPNWRVGHANGLLLRGRFFRVRISIS